MKFEQWMRAVTTELQSRYCLSEADLGWDESLKARYFGYDLSPSDFIEWFAEKYGLSALETSYGLPPKSRSRSKNP